MSDDSNVNRLKRPLEDRTSSAAKRGSAPEVAPTIRQGFLYNQNPLQLNAGIGVFPPPSALDGDRRCVLLLSARVPVPDERHEASTLKWLHHTREKTPCPLFLPPLPGGCLQTYPPPLKKKNVRVHGENERTGLSSPKSEISGDNTVHPTRCLEGPLTATTCAGALHLRLHLERGDIAPTNQQTWHQDQGPSPCGPCPPLPRAPAFQDPFLHADAAANGGTARLTGFPEACCCL